MRILQFLFQLFFILHIEAVESAYSKFRIEASTVNLTGIDWAIMLGFGLIMVAFGWRAGRSSTP